MKTDRLLYLSAHQMTAYRWQSGVLTNEGMFATTEAGYQEFSAYLAQHSKSIFAILANVSEEGFQIETIPFLQGASRKAIIARKLGQLFFNATLTTSTSLGYIKEQRKDERIMLAALTNSDFFAPWLSAITRAEVALSGVFSLPLLASLLLKKLHLGEDHCLLLTVQDQSIRQSYYDKGELHFSRLTPLHNSSIGGIAQTLSAETLKLQQYLANQRIIGHDQPITAHILAHPSALKAIQNSCIDTTTIRFNILDIGDCGKRAGLKSPLTDIHCEQMFLNLLAVSPPSIQFANDSLRHGYHLAQIRDFLHALGALALATCLLLSGKLAWEASSLTRETQSLKSETEISMQRHNAIVNTLPPIPTDNETLHRLIERYKELEQRSTGPAGLYREISRAVQVAPAVDLDTIDWRIGGSEPTAATAPSQASAVSAVPGDSESAIVRGTLRLGSNATPRQLIAAFNKLLEALKANPNLQIDVLQRPVDIESGKSLKGSDVSLDDDKPHAFSLQITRKIKP